VRNSCDYLTRHHGFEVSVIGVDHQGFIDIDELQRALRSNTTLCSIQYANNEVGTIQPIARIAKLCRAVDVPFHTDAVQAAGLLPIDQHHVPVDLLSLSAHKFGGPKGIGVLLKGSSIFLEPLLHGGGQEFGTRSGTSNVAGAVGLAAALHTAESARSQNTAHLSSLRDELIKGVLAARPDALLTGSQEQRLAHHASFCFPGTSGESILLDLETAGIAASSGSACAAGQQEPSPVLLAMGYAAEVAETAVRFTLGTETTSDDIAAVHTFFASGHRM
jgi:cysteine desulfurase